MIYIRVGGVLKKNLAKKSKLNPSSHLYLWVRVLEVTLFSVRTGGAYTGKWSVSRTVVHDAGEKCVVV